jgi:hypothetical protein
VLLPASAARDTFFGKPDLRKVFDALVRVVCWRNDPDWGAVCHRERSTIEAISEQNVAADGEIERKARHITIRSNEGDPRNALTGLNPRTEPLQKVGSPNAISVGDAMVPLMRSFGETA